MLKWKLISILKKKIEKKEKCLISLNEHLHFILFIFTSFLFYSKEFCKRKWMRLWLVAGLREVATKSTKSLCVCMNWTVRSAVFIDAHILQTVSIMSIISWRLTLKTHPQLPHVSPWMTYKTCHSDVTLRSDTGVSNFAWNPFKVQSRGN